MYRRRPSSQDSAPNSGGSALRNRSQQRTSRIPSATTVKNTRSRSTSVDRASNVFESIRRPFSSRRMTEGVPGSAMRQSLGYRSVMKPPPSSSRRFSRYESKENDRRLSMASRRPVVMKDIRPLGDRDFQQQCYADLKMFINDSSITERLTKPDRKAFIDVFYALASRISPQLVKSSIKIEEYFPAFLRSIGYPFIVSKLNMYNFNAPHFWPQVLGGLVFIMDTIKIFESLKAQGLHNVCANNEQTTSKSLFLQRCAPLYMKFMKLPLDVVPDEILRIETEKITESHNRDYAERVSCRQAEYEEVSAELRRFEESKDNIETATLDHQTAQKSFSDISAYQKQLQEHLQQRIGKLNEAKHQINLEGAEATALNAQIQRLRDAIAAQPYTQAEVQQMKTQLSCLRDKVHRQQEEYDNIVSDKGALEIEYTKLQSKIEAHVTKHNSLVRKLELYPEAASRYPGFDITLSSAVWAMSSFSSMKDHVTQLQEDMNRTKKKREDEWHAVKQVLTQASSRAGDLKREMGTLESKRERFLKHNLETEKLMRHEESQMETELKSLETDLDRLAVLLVDKKPDIMLNDVIQRLHEDVQQHVLARKYGQDSIQKLATNILSYKTNAAALTQELCGQYEAVASRQTRDHAAVVQQLEQLRSQARAWRREVTFTSDSEDSDEDL